MNTQEAEQVEQVANGPVVENDRTHLSTEQQAMLRALLQPGVKVESVIPAEASADDLWRTLDACVHGLSVLEARILRLKPIIGQILIMFEKRPSLYKDLGYETYSDFMNRGVYNKLGLHRTSAYQGKLAARDWPQLGPDRYVKIGPKKLDILSKFSTGRDQNAEALLRCAETMKVKELQTYCEQRGFINPGETVGATFSMTTNRSRLKFFMDFFKDGRVQSVVGSKDWDAILEAAIQECLPEWIVRFEEQMTAQQQGGQLQQ